MSDGKKGEVYKCEICGNIVAVLQGGDGDLVCCGEDMHLVGASKAKDFLAGLPKIGVI
jgi:superoxide reductase